MITYKVHMEYEFHVDDSVKLEDIVSDPLMALYEFNYELLDADGYMTSSNEEQLNLF